MKLQTLHRQSSAWPKVSGCLKFFFYVKETYNRLFGLHFSGYSFPIRFPKRYNYLNNFPKLLRFNAFYFLLITQTELLAFSSNEIFLVLGTWWTDLASSLILKKFVCCNSADLLDSYLLESNSQLLLAEGASLTENIGISIFSFRFFTGEGGSESGFLSM